MEIKIKELAPEDAIAINALTRQLGYPLPVEQTLENIKAVMASKDHTAFAAVYNGQLVGWIGLALPITIESIPYCEINGLVVDEKCRGLGVGKQLFEKAKQWAGEKGMNRLRLRCNIIRTEAHIFYRHLGFTETKQQKSFEIMI